MKNEDLQRLKDAFNQWAKSVPNPDEPVAGFMGGKMLSAKEIACAVENETSDGKAFLDVMEHAVTTHGIDKVVAQLTRRPGKP